MAKIADVGFAKILSQSAHSQLVSLLPMVSRSRPKGHAAGGSLCRARLGPVVPRSQAVVAFGGSFTPSAELDAGFLPEIAVSADLAWTNHLNGPVASKLYWPTAQFSCLLVATA